MHMAYSQAPNKLPHHRLLIFRFFLTRRNLLGPAFINVKDIDFFTRPSFHVLSLLVLFTPNFHGRIVYCCIYFSIMLYDNLFLFFPALYNHLKPFLKIRPFVYYFSEFFPTPLFIRTHPAFIWYF